MVEYKSSVLYSNEGTLYFYYSLFKRLYAPVAQLDRALACGARGRKFESCRVYHKLYGEVQEWLNWPLSKSGMGQLIEGSNPSLSAIDIMKITIITIGKKHEAWIQPGIFRFLERLRAPFAAEMIILPHSSFEGDRARQEESERIFSRLNSDDFVILLDERGKNLSSPELSDLITEHIDKHIVFIIGGAYGVTSDLRQKSNVVWSLSNLVFPHQLVRLILAEQLYRAQEIHRGSHYHHS